MERRLKDSGLKRSENRIKWRIVVSGEEGKAKEALKQRNDCRGRN